MVEGARRRANVERIQDARRPAGQWFRRTNAGGTVAQCLLGTTGLGQCDNRFPVQFDRHGNGLGFQYQVEAGPGTKATRRADDPPCVPAVLLEEQQRCGSRCSTAGATAARPGGRRAPGRRRRRRRRDRLRVSGVPSGTAGGARLCPADAGPRRKRAANGSPAGPAPAATPSSSSRSRPARSGGECGRRAPREIRPRPGSGAAGTVSARVRGRPDSDDNGAAWRPGLIVAAAPLVVAAGLVRRYRLARVRGRRRRDGPGRPRRLSWFRRFPGFVSHAAGAALVCRGVR